VAKPQCRRNDAPGFGRDAPLHLGRCERLRCPKGATTHQGQDLSPLRGMYPPLRGRRRKPGWFLLSLGSARSLEGSEKPSGEPLLLSPAVHSWHGHLLHSWGPVCSSCNRRDLPVLAAAVLALPLLLLSTKARCPCPATLRTGQ